MKTHMRSIHAYILTELLNGAVLHVSRSDRTAVLQYRERKQSQPFVHVEYMLKHNWLKETTTIEFQPLHVVTYTIDAVGRIVLEYQNARTFGAPPIASEFSK